MNGRKKVTGNSSRPGAHKNAEAFVKAAIVREAALAVDRTSGEQKKIVRAIIKEAHNVCGDVLIDNGLGRFDPGAAN